MNAMAQLDPDAAILDRRLQIKAWICLIDGQLAPSDSATELARAKILLREFQISGRGELTSPAGTDGHAIGLPPLSATNRLTPPATGTEAHKAWSAIHRAPPGPDRWRFRSRTFQGIANACAAQWGDHITEEPHL